MEGGFDVSVRDMFDTFHLGRMNMKNRFVVPGINRFRADPKTC